MLCVSHGSLLAEQVGDWGLEAWDSSLGHSRLLRTQDPGLVQEPRGSQDAGSNRRVSVSSGASSLDALCPEE